MKKIILSIVLFGAFLSFAPVIHAEITPQMIQSAQQSPEFKSQLIQLIIQLIAVLQEQLKVAIAQQNSLHQIAQNPAVIQYLPVPISSAPQSNPLSLSCSGAVGSLDDPNYQINFTANASGGTGDYKYYWGGFFSETGGCTITNPRVPNMTFSDAIGTLNSDCPMVNSNTFTGTSHSIPPSSINSQLATNPLWYWPEKGRFSTKSDYLPLLMTVWVKSGNDIVASHCSININ